LILLQARFRDDRVYCTLSPPKDAQTASLANPSHARSAPFSGPPMDTQTIQTLIEQGLPGARAQVQGADGVHFEATVVAAAFAGKPPLARHRMVYATLGERMGGEIHALSLKTMTPEEASQSKS
jgi:acid stress-induced BolA-like protein IbaG/YrbA